MDNKTPGNFGYGDMSSGYRTRYQMNDRSAQQRKRNEKKKRKNR